MYQAIYATFVRFPHVPLLHVLFFLVLFTSCHYMTSALHYFSTGLIICIHFLHLSTAGISLSCFLGREGGCRGWPWVHRVYLFCPLVAPSFFWFAFFVTFLLIPSHFVLFYLSLFSYYILFLVFFPSGGSPVSFPWVHLSCDHGRIS